MEAVDYVCTRQTIIRYRDSDGRGHDACGVPYFALIDMTLSGKKYPYESAPVSGVIGHERPVVFYLDFEWSDMDGLLENDVVTNHYWGGPSISWDWLQKARAERTLVAA